MTDFTGLSGGPGFLPANPRETHWQVEDGISWTLGRHQTKFGYRYVRRMTSTYTGPPGGGPRGDMTFGKNFTNDPVTNTQGTGLATLLIGYISGGGGRSILLEPYYTTNQDHGLYFQDDWRVAPKLTLNLGVRYDVFVPDVEIRNRLVNFDLTNLVMAYAGEDGISDTARQGDPQRQLRPAGRHGVQRGRERQDHYSQRLRHQLLPDHAVGFQHARRAGAVHCLADSVRQHPDQSDQFFEHPDHQPALPGDSDGEAAHHGRDQCATRSGSSDTASPTRLPR